MRHPCCVYIRDQPHDAFYLPGTPATRHDPAEGDEVEVPGLPSLSEDDHPLLYENLIEQAREQYLDARGGMP